MTAPCSERPGLGRRLRAWLADGAYMAAVALLVVWATGLAVATVRLHDWQGELRQTLVQLKADAQFRHHIVRETEAVDPEWYRRKALNLLAAVERLHTERMWTTFMPGSWRRFDDLQQRVEARLAREFDEIVVETMRRELYRRAAELTGWQGAGRPPGAASALACAAPQPAPGQRPLSAAPQDLAEFAAVRGYVDRIEALDAAMRALAALRQPGAADPAQLRLLLRYTLGAELPGPLERSAAMFQHPAGAQGQPVGLQDSLLLGGIRAASRCSLAKGMDALYQRLLESNQLLALEQSLAQAGQALFAPGRDAPAFERAREGYRTMLALLRDQEALLAAGGNGWMAEGTLRLGSAYEDLMARIGRSTLLGPQAVAQLEQRAQAAFARFRGQFARLYQGGEPGVVWLPQQGRFGFSPDRVALRDGLDALLRAPFMAQDMAGLPAADMELGLRQALDWVAERDAFVQMHLAALPQPARAAVAQLVDARVAELVYEPAFRAVKAQVARASGPIDTAAYRARGASIAQLQRLLHKLRAGDLGQRLLAAHQSELRQRLEHAEQGLHELWLVLPSAWAPGEAQEGVAPLWQAFGANDAASLQRTLYAQAARLERLTSDMSGVLGVADAGLLRQPQARRWQQLAGEVERWRSRSPASSLAALEQYLIGLGPQLRRESCAERLALQRLPPDQDPVAHALRQLHQSLSSRCAQLRAAPPAPSRPPPAPIPPPLYAPFG